VIEGIPTSPKAARPTDQGAKPEGAQTEHSCRLPPFTVSQVCRASCADAGTRRTPVKTCKRCELQVFSRAS